MEWRIENNAGDVVCEKSYQADGQDSTQNVRDSIVIETCCLAPDYVYTLVCITPDDYLGWDYDSSSAAHWIQNDKAYVLLDGWTYCDKRIRNWENEISNFFHSNVNISLKIENYFSV